jgi:alkylmercury lyase
MAEAAASPSPRPSGTSRRSPVAELARDLAAAIGELDRDEQDVALAVYRQLARGVPVAVGDLAAALGRGAEEIEATLQRWTGVFRDEEGRIVAFWGLTLAETPHRLHVGGRTLHAWCAWDTLFLPALVDQLVEVASRSPASGEPIRLTVSAAGVEKVAPEATVVSMLAPGADFDETVVISFCHHVHFFTSAADAEPWLAEHAGTFLLSLPEAFELGRLTNAARFPALLGGAAGAGDA